VVVRGFKWLENMVACAGWVCVSRGGGAEGVSEKSGVVGPREFIEEARCDLEIAEMIMRHERFKLGVCESDTGVFCLGRRALYMLQQAVEKATKAYYLAFFKVVVNNLANLAQLCESTSPRARAMRARLRNLSSKLEPLQISHAPHKTLVEIMKGLRGPRE
jgi:hypothetical protein